MTVRLHFTALDLARTRVAPVGPLDETAAAIWLLQRRDGELLLNGWRRRKLDLIDPAARRLGALIPAVRCISLDIFTLSGGPAATMDQALDNLRARARGDVVEEARYADESRPLSSWTRGLTVGDPGARRLLDESLRSAYRTIVRPHDRQITAHYAARRASYARTFFDGGVDALLSSLHPMISWRAPVLELPGPNSGARHLAGRGLILAPAFFDLVPRLTWNLADESAPPVLHIPPPDLLTRARTLAATDPDDNALATVMGATRAAILRRIAEGATTTQLATAVGVSTPNASEHASALRAAGLTAAERRGNTVWHTATPLGQNLLNQDL